MGLPQAAAKAYAHILKLHTQIQEPDEEWNLHFVPLVDIDETAGVLRGIPTYYHLDTGMSEPLMNGEVLLCRDMTSFESYESIVDVIGTQNVIELTSQEGQQRSANLVSNGHNVVMSKCSDRLRGELEKRGYTIITASDFGFSDFDSTIGDAHCLVNEVPAPIQPSR